MGEPTNLAVSLFYSDTWNHARSYVRDTVKASWGLRDEGDALVPANCNAQLDNRDLNYSPDDARSPLYGLIGRNTPGRVTLAPGLSTGALSDTADAFGRTVSSSWGSADTGGAWTNFGSGGSVLASDWAVSGGFGTQSVPAANAYRASYLGGISVRDVDIAVTFKVAQATGASLEPANIMVRGTSTASYILIRVNVTTANAVTIQIYDRDSQSLGSATVSGLTHTGTGKPLRVRVQAAGQRLYARVWDAASAEPSDWHLAVVDTGESPASGWIGVRSGRASGNSNTSPVVFSYDDWESTTYIPIADGAVSSWRPDKAPGNVNNAWTDIEITGPSQRVNASKVVKSPLRSTLDASIRDGEGPAVYWPMEGYEQQPQFVLSAVPGVPDATHTAAASVAQRQRFDWAGDATLAGSKPLPLLQGNRTIIAGILGAPISVTPDPSFGMAIWTRTPRVATGDAHGINTQAIQTFSCVDAITGFSLVLITYPPGSTLATTPADGEVQVRLNLTLSGVIDQTLLITDLPYVDGWRFVYANLNPNGADVDVTIYIDDELVGASTFTSVTLQELVRTTALGFQQDTTGDTVGSIAVGHPMGMADSSTDMRTLAAKVYQAGIAYPGESGAARFLRLLGERGIPGAVYGTDSHLMGPQPIDTLQNLLAEIARTDAGLMYDGRGWNGLEFRTGASLRNHTAALALTFGENGNVHTPLRPATDDLGITNDVTANGRDGSSFRVERTSGPNNVNDPTDDPEGISRTESTVDANPDEQGELQDIAAWALHLGTWPGARYKNVTIDLSKHPELLESAVALRPGDLITIDELDADQVQLLVLGGTDTVPTHDHRVTFNCVPAGPYRVGQVETDGFMRIGSSSSSLAADFNAGVDTTMSVAIAAGGALWSTTASPFHARVGGVVVNVTAVSGAASPQTFTVDQTPVNGVERLISASGPSALTKVNVESPIYVGR